MIELIAEVSSNHGGDRALMEAFIATYAEAGADWVKFQSYQVKTLRPGDPQRDWLAQAELSDDDHWFLKETCQRCGVKFLTTVFHRSRVPFLASLGLEAIKVGSGESGEASLAMLGDVFPLVLASARKNFIFHGPKWRYLKCLGRYPSPEWLSDIYVTDFFGWEGWSDHNVGMDAALQAVGHGARIIEKHVSLPEQKREKRSWEATVAEFRELRQFADDDPQKYVGRWQHGE